MLNFNTEKRGTPIHLDNSKEPAFYINAGDIDFIERANKLYEDIKKYSAKSTKKTKDMKKDKNGVPKDSMIFIAEMKKEFDFILSKLDDLLGEGVTAKVFKGKYSQTLLSDFMEFLSGAISQERGEYLNKYKKQDSAKDIL